MAARGDDPGYREELLRIGGTREPDGQPVNLDATLYLPRSSTPAPAVLLAHGFGGTQKTVADDARYLVKHGYVVLAYSARGFGSSGGRIHLDSPQYEVRDARLLLDYLAGRPEVAKDGPRDPSVGVVGESYGGALALELAGVDRRVDAIVPSITWHDLRQALFPQFAVGSAVPDTPAGLQPAGPAGVFKKAWAAAFFGSSLAASASTAAPAPVATPPPTAAQSRSTLQLQTLSTACGRFAVDICLGYLQSATDGVPSADFLKLLALSSPARVVDRVTAPTLLIQGQTDSLFPLSEGDANAAAIAANGTPVDVVWTAGGHDGGIEESKRLTGLTRTFLDRVLRGEGAGVDAPFQVTVPDAVVSSIDSNPAPQLRTAAAYPARVGATRHTRLPLVGSEQLAISPPGATPAALTSLPGLGAALGLAGSATGTSLDLLPGQAATFQTAPLDQPLTVVGAPRVTIRVRSTAQDATLFASVQDVAPDGRATLPRGLVSPVRVERVPSDGAVVTVALPAVVHDVPVGHRLRVVVSSTDQGYAVPLDARGYRISLAGDQALSVPLVPLTATTGRVSGGLAVAAIVMLAVLVLGVLAAILAARFRGRRLARDADRELAGVPVSVTGLGKVYGDGFRAVSDLTLRVERGQVLGLLGPNGAGKTTTLRMVLGLIHPSEGEIRLFGHRVAPGAPVLSRVGAFVEGPGFLPHLSGLANLQLFWQATGRPEQDARIDVALEIAGLDDDIHRKVRTYSHGMKQRLAIAQAMLGLPELLVLDEPTNGLDPPQIREMRDVLAQYAATGRTVVISSHLLAEVEQTCSHVVVMQSGRLVAQGPVAELVGAASSTAIDVDDPLRAARVARVVAGARDLTVTQTGLVLRSDAATRARVIRTLVMAGVRVDRVAPQRSLEDTFLALVGES